MKVDREKQIIVIDEYLEEVSVEELQVNWISGHWTRPKVIHDLIIGTASLSPAAVHRLLLQNGSRRPNVLPNVLHFLHTARFNGWLTA